MSVFVYSGCRTGGLFPSTGQALRISEAVDRGDAARRASSRLVVQGLDADSQYEPRRAQGSYERAVQVDPTNPYAYLALARHHLDAGDPAQAANFIDQAAALFEAEGIRSPRVEVHLLGLRAWGLDRMGSPAEAASDRNRAAALAPGVWGDGYLSPEELR
jgi:tetratricopeptide (TPR) repeat protein